MSDRERWIVYPLLFFALALALRDKVAPSSTLRVATVHCADLQAGVINGNVLRVNDAGVNSLVVGAQALADGKKHLVEPATGVIRAQSVVIEKSLLVEGLLQTLELKAGILRAIELVAEKSLHSRGVLICNSAVVVDADGKPRVELGLAIRNGNEPTDAGIMILYGADGKPIVQLGPELDGGGGEITAYAADGVAHRLPKKSGVHPVIVPKKPAPSPAPTSAEKPATEKPTPEEPKVEQPKTDGP